MVSCPDRERDRGVTHVTEQSARLHYVGTMNEQAVSTLKAIIKELHANPDADRSELARRFKSAAVHVSAVDIATAEQEAIEEGIPLESVRKLCDVHLDLFTDEAQRSRAELPPGHPLVILYSEHDTLLSQIRAARKLLLPEGGEPTPSPAEMIAMVTQTLKVMEAAPRYFEKEENALFPVIERYGITRPPAIMWSEHDALREIFKEFAGLGPADRERGGRLLLSAEEILSSHVHKEETILFRTALSHIQPDEWRAIRRDFDEIGYMHAATPPALETGAPSAKAAAPPTSAPAVPAPSPPAAATEQIELPSGSLSKLHLEAILNALPVDVTFVDADDRVAYFNEPAERVFPRARSVIGRTVQNCHPPKSVHVVEEILRTFKSGERDSEEFYLHLGERYVYIQYFAVRDTEGRYLGCLEASQDIAPIQSITGEKRILE
ncbi:MAG: DUF438 domain-containing protein [Spirochaetaceae bacterium]|nr:MAG: DUF438 domain-containing protein [Spirochaetaceae bacterium]